MAPHTATEVFSIPELLNFILLELPFYDLVVAQGVCRQWQEVIEASKPMQEKLFFQPIEKKHPGEYNPFLRTLFPNFFACFDRPLAEAYEMTRSMFYDLDWFRDEKRRAKILRPDASWRRMLCAQPHDQVVEISEVYNCNCDWHPYQEYGRIIKHYMDDWDEYDHGVMGEVWDIFAFLLDTTKQGRIAIEWIGAGSKSQPFFFIFITRYRRDQCGVVCKPSGLAIVDFDPEAIGWTDEPPYTISYLRLYD